MRRLFIALLAYLIAPATISATLDIVATTNKPTQEAKEIGRFMKTEGGLLDHSPEEIEAFQRVGLEAKVMNFFSAGDKPSTGSWDGVIVLPQGSVTSPHSNKITYKKSKHHFLDTGDFDRLYKAINEGHGYKVSLFEIGMIPKSLSSNPDHEKYWGFAPKNLEAFGAAIQEAAQYVKEHHKVSGAKYLLFGEPEANDPETGNWFGCGPKADYCTPKDNPADVFYKTFIMAYYAIKSVDPKAELIGPTSGVCDAPLARTIASDTRKGFDEFVEAISRYNRANPDMPVHLKSISWQGYDWDNSGRLASCVNKVKSTLKRYGFDGDNIKQYIIGWNGNWTSADPIPMSGNKRAAYIAANILEQVKPNGGKIDIEEAYIFTWNAGHATDPMEAGLDPAQGLVSTKPLKGKAGICLQAPYAVMEMLHAMRGGKREGSGDFVHTKIANSPTERVQAATTRHGDKFIMMIANNSKDSHLMNTAFEQLPFPKGTKIYYTVQRVNEANGAGCKGLENGTTHEAKILDSKGQKQLKLPTLELSSNSVTMITAWAK